MTGKVWIQSQAKFSNIKRNTRFLQWLAGSTTSPIAPHIELFRSILSGTKIVAAGMFLNIVTRQDLGKLLQLRPGDARSTALSRAGRYGGLVEQAPAGGGTLQLVQLPLC
jgi:hypothetical protein